MYRFVHLKQGQMMPSMDLFCLPGWLSAAFCGGGAICMLSDRKGPGANAATDVGPGRKGSGANAASRCRKGSGANAAPRCGGPGALRMLSSRKGSGADTGACCVRAGGRGSDSTGSGSAGSGGIDPGGKGSCTSIT